MGKRGGGGEVGVDRVGCGVVSGAVVWCGVPNHCSGFPWAKHETSISRITPSPHIRTYDECRHSSPLVVACRARAALLGVWSRPLTQNTIVLAGFRACANDWDHATAD